jgi:hypothetical protein
VPADDKNGGSRVKIRAALDGLHSQARNVDRAMWAPIFLAK